MDVEKQPVSAGAVIGGLVVAGIVGFILTIVGTLGGMFVFDETHSKPLGMLVAVGVPTVIDLLIYEVSRRRSPDFARGVLIGLCLVVLWSGACGYSLVGARIAG